MADHRTPSPYRMIVEWTSREVKELPPDPEEPQHGLDQATWSKIRCAEPRSRAYWRVKLACGHVHDSVITDADWRPEQGPELVTAERAAEMRSELEKLWELDGDLTASDENERDHWRRMIDLRWPQPSPEVACYTCRHAYRVTGYQRVGWLIPRTRPAAVPKSPKSPDRRRIEAQLSKIEAEAESLRKRLRELDNGAG
ncbi:hypothetical protein GCM10028864_68640 [Microlunatus parietis]